VSDIRQGLFGLLTAALSALIILGSFALSMAEGEIRLALAPSPTALTGQTNPTFPSIATPLPGEPVFTPTGSNPQAVPPEAQAPVSTPTGQSGPTNMVPAGASPTPPAPPPLAACDQPPGWNRITVQPGDTLRSLANKHDLDPAELAAKNCLVAETLLPGTTLFVPGRQQAVEPTQKCGPPAGWVYYTVRQGDTLYRLSRILGVTVGQLQDANCMANQTIIRVGQQIFVPFLPAPPTLIPPTRTNPPPTAPRTPTPVPPTATNPPVNTQPPATTVPAIPTERPPTRTPRPTTPPPTDAPPPTLPPTTEPPPVTEPPVTIPPTEPQPTEPPVTQPPVTEPPRPTLEP
jgi:LysM repeat protein